MLNQAYDNINKVQTEPDPMSLSGAERIKVKKSQSPSASQTRYMRPAGTGPMFDANSMPKSVYRQMDTARDLTETSKFNEEIALAGSGIG